MEVSVQEKDGMIEQTIDSSLAIQQWWGDLSSAEQKLLKEQTVNLASASLQLGYSRLAIGESLGAIQSILEPHGLFVAFLKSFQWYSERTAYRYIAGWKNAHNQLPEIVLRQALMRGMDMIGYTDEQPLGPYTEVVAENPPPKKATPASADKWLELIQDKYAMQRNQPRAIVPRMNKDEVVRKLFQVASRELRKLPPRSRSACINRLAGTLMQWAEIESPHTINPQPVPAGWEILRGRPKKNA